MRCYVIVMVFLLTGLLIAPSSAQTPKAFPKTFGSPLKEKKWKPDVKFGQKINDDVLLGEDMHVEPGTQVLASGKGRLIHPRTIDQAEDGIVVLAHWVSKTQAVFSVYRPVTLKDGLKYGEIVEKGQVIGTVKKAPKEKTYLRFQFNLDPYDKYRGGYLANYASPNPPDRLLDHIAPSEVLAAKDPVALLSQEEKNPKRKQ